MIKKTKTFILSYSPSELIMAQYKFGSVVVCHIYTCTISDGVNFLMFVIYGNILVKGIRLTFGEIDMFIYVDTTIKHDGMF